jgi:hypothetical protein
MKFSVSLLFTTPYIFPRTHWSGDQLVARPLFLYTNTENIDVLSGIRTHDPVFRASEDTACLTVTGFQLIYSVTFLPPDSTKPIHTHAICAATNDISTVLSRKFSSVGLHLPGASVASGSHASSAWGSRGSRQCVQQHCEIDLRFLAIHLSTGHWTLRGPAAESSVKYPTSSHACI